MIMPSISGWGAEKAELSLVGVIGVAIREVVSHAVGVTSEGAIDHAEHWSTRGRARLRDGKSQPMERGQHEARERERERAIT